MSGLFDAIQRNIVSMGGIMNTLNLFYSQKGQIPSTGKENLAMIKQYKMRMAQAGFNLERLGIAKL